MALAGELTSSNLAQLQQLLVCAFGLLFSSTPGGQNQQQQQRQGINSGSGAAATPYKGVSSTPQRQTLTPSRAAAASGGVTSAAGGGSSIRAQLLLRELRQVPLLPVVGRPGLLVAAQGGATSFNAAAVAAAGSAVTTSDTSSSSSKGLDMSSGFGPSAKVFFPLNHSSSSRASDAQQLLPPASTRPSVLSTPPRSNMFIASTPSSASRSRVPLHSGLRDFNTWGPCGQRHCCCCCYRCCNSCAACRGCSAALRHHAAAASGCCGRFQRASLQLQC
jgi:hypothetical protein